MVNKFKRALVFGTFDGLDYGHKFFLQRARTHAMELIVAVARDSHVSELKHKSALNNESARLNAVKNLPVVCRAFFCDEELGSFDVILRENPDVIVLGYDQLELQKELVRWMGENGLYIPLKRAKAFKKKVR